MALTIKEDTWGKGESLLTFLEKHHILNDAYFKLSKTDKELCSEINAGVEYQMLLDKNKQLIQALIPISEHMQIYIFRNKLKNYAIDFVPINYQEITQTISFPIKYSPYQDIITATNNKNLANEFIRAFKSSVNFKRIRQGDTLAIKYTQKIRHGRYFGTPEIIGALVEVNGRENFIFHNKKDNRYYDDKGRSLTSYFLKIPLRYKRISSKFTHKRWHPILKKYRAHLGIDYAAPTGRRIYATADGKITYKARKGGYGKTIEIRHKGGYKSLYAHMSRYAKVKKGQWVKQGRHIGYVGSTGRSTGPHLHFGLYKNGRAINPARVLSITKKKLKGQAKKTFLKYTKTVKTQLATEAINPLKLDKFSILYRY